MNTGAFDPFGRNLRERAPRPAHGSTWTGLLGSGQRLRPPWRHLTAGIAQADSWATDAHKWLNVPYDSGLAFVRDADALRAAMAVTAEYLPTDSPYRNPSDFTPELSRRARGVEVWAALRSLGRQGVADMVERSCRHARRFAEGSQAAGYAVLNDVVLNQVLVSFGDAQTDAARDRGDPGRRHLLVRRHGLAGADGHAHQRLAPGRPPMTTSSAASRRCCGPRQAWIEAQPALIDSGPYDFTGTSYRRSVSAM